MLKSLRKGLGLVLVVIALGALPLPARAAYYPEHGDFVYPGGLYANSYFTWQDPGGPPQSGTGYEHDFAISPTFFDGCTTWTTLPEWYDDCPTAGISEAGSRYVFSFGTYNSLAIVAGRQYRGDWFFTRPATDASTSANYDLVGQAVYRQFCPFKWIWCMGGTGSYKTFINEGTLTYGQYHVNWW